MEFLREIKSSKEKKIASLFLARKKEPPVEYRKPFRYALRRQKKCDLVNNPGVAVVCGKRVGTNNLSAAFVGVYRRKNVFHRRESVTSACSEMLERNIVRQILVERVNADRECRVK